MLRDCPFSIKVWSPTPILGMIPRHEDCFTFIASLQVLKVQPQINITSAALFSWILWNIWTTRNHLIFSDKRYTEEEIVAKLISEAKHWQEAQNLRPRLSMSPVVPDRIPEVTFGFVCFFRRSMERCFDELRHGMDSHLR